MKASSIPLTNNTQPGRYYPHGLPDRSPKDAEDEENEEVLMTLSFDETKHDDNAFDTFLSQCFEEDSQPVPHTLEEDAPEERSQSPCLSILSDSFDEKDVNAALPISPISHAKESMMLVMMQEMSPGDTSFDNIVENPYHNVDDDSSTYLPRLNISLSMEPDTVASITDSVTDSEMKKPLPLSLKMPTLSCKSLDSALVEYKHINNNSNDNDSTTTMDNNSGNNISSTSSTVLSRPGSARGRTQFICTQALQRAQSISTALSTAFIEHKHQQLEKEQERKRLLAEKQLLKQKIQEREQQLLKKKQALLTNAKQGKAFDSSSFDKSKKIPSTTLKTLPTTSLKSVSYDSYHPPAATLKVTSAVKTTTTTLKTNTSLKAPTALTATTSPNNAMDLRSRSVSPATVVKHLSPTSPLQSTKNSNSTAKIAKVMHNTCLIPKRTNIRDDDTVSVHSCKSTVSKMVYPRSIVAKQKEIVVKIPLHCANNRK